MLPYKEYEKQVYDWLMSKNSKIKDFTFSLRQKANKGSELNYFIGTEKSKYFSTTFWTIHVAFPGSSSDCINLTFRYRNEGFKYQFDFKQTKNPSNEQNTSALELLKSIREPLLTEFGLKRDAKSENKTYALRTNPRKGHYDKIEDMMKDVEKDLNLIIPIVNNGIEKEKETNPNFVAHRITTEEFKDMQQWMKDRFNKYESEKPTKDSIENKKQYWLYAPGENAHKWDEFYDEGIMALGWDELGDLKQYKNRKEIKNALINAYGGDGSKKNDVSANDDFINKLNIGDIIIAKKGRNIILGYGVVTSEYYFDKTRNNFQSCRKVDWKLKGSWNVDFNNVLKTLTDITGYPSEHPDYDKHYERLLGLMKQNYMNKNFQQMTYPLNQILYGPPGTGKTYNTIVKAAEIIENRKIDDFLEAKTIFNKRLGDRIEFITFHQNYSYEDFIQGLRPDVDNDTSLTFDRKDGIFKLISDRALENLYLSEKAPEEVSKDALFDNALEDFIEKVQDSEDGFHINDSVAYITEVLDNSFRYKGPNWGHSSLMKFKDLKELYRNDVKNRQDVKKLSTISGLANQHASYFLRVYIEIVKLLPKQEVVDTTTKVEQENYVIIIDEINRANISRVFGELITLIELDKRSHGDIPLKSTLPSGEEFMVASNLYIIGTMNTADKSIALLDIALRRRFEFVAMYPKYGIDGHEIYDVDILEKINKKIIEKKGHDFQIGHSYFMGENKDLKTRMNVKVIPLLLEYFMNDKEEVEKILTDAGLEIEQGSWPLRITGRRDQSI